MKYSATTNLVYFDTQIDIPDDAFDLSTESYNALIYGVSQGQVITKSPDGFPVLVNPPGQSNTSLATSARQKRDALLEMTDWIVVKSVELTTPIPTNYITYRQNLRDVPTQVGFPDSISWPQL
jgi:hypothetical protein